MSTFPPPKITVSYCPQIPKVKIYRTVCSPLFNSKLAARGRNSPSSWESWKTYEDEGETLCFFSSSKTQTGSNSAFTRTFTEISRSVDNLRLSPQKHREKLPVTLHLWNRALKNIGLIISPSDDGWPAKVEALAKCLFGLDGGENLSGVRFHFEASAGSTSPSVEVQPSCSRFDIGPPATTTIVQVTPCGVEELKQ